jgi:hypothetical protein
VSVTVHVEALPAQPPDHPVNVAPAAEDAVSVTAAPLAYGALHVLPQLMRRSAEATDPIPIFDTLIDGTLMTAAVICALIRSPTSSGPGKAQLEFAHST